MTPSDLTSLGVNAGINFLMSVPVWAILLLYFNRNIRARDAFEKDVGKDIKTITASLAALDKDLALQAKDVEHAGNLGTIVIELTKTVSKVQYDINNYFERVKSLETRVDS